MSDGTGDANGSGRSGEKSTDGSREPIDLQKRRLARELEGELGGLFGIELPDIESAIQRLYEDFATGRYDERARLRRLPEPLHAVIQNLDRIYEIARLEAEAELDSESEDTAKARGQTAGEFGSGMQDRAGGEASDGYAGQADTENSHEPATVAHIIELVENYLDRIKKLSPGSREL